MTPISIKKNDYFVYCGVNLDLILMNNPLDDGTSGADKFLENLSIDVWNYLKSSYFIDEELFEKNITNDPSLVKEYKRALCLQVDYIISSGDALSNFEVAKQGVKNLAPKAFMIFKNLGLANIQPDLTRWRWF